MSCGAGQTVARQDEWEDNNHVCELGMSTTLDLGQPTALADKLVLILAALNALLGTILRLLNASSAGKQSILIDYIYPSVGAGFMVGRPLHFSGEGCNPQARRESNEACDSSVWLACFIVTFFSSWFVYRTLFTTAFRWYNTLQYMIQMASVLSITGANRDYLPCYIDLRNEGNLEAWCVSTRYLGSCILCLVIQNAC